MHFFFLREKCSCIVNLFRMRLFSFYERNVPGITKLLCRKVCFSTRKMFFASYIYSVEMCVYSTNDMFLASYIYSIRQCVYSIRDLFLSLYIHFKGQCVYSKRKMFLASYINSVGR